MAKAKAKKKPASQQQQKLKRWPLLKKPLELVGEQIGVPGDFWQGRMSRAELQTLYMCTCRDFYLLHNFSPTHKAAAFEMQEMGPQGTGSLEHGDASGEIFYIEYPFPFLEYYYATFPDRLPQENEAAKESAAVRNNVSQPRVDGDGEAIDMNKHE
jgi:hypothetical protein